MRKLPRMHRTVTAALAVATAAITLAACSSSGGGSSNQSSGGNATTGATPPASTGSAGGGGASSGGGNIKKGLTVYFIPKNTQNPYEVIADKGGERALKELGGKVVVSSGANPTVPDQIRSIQAATQAHANAIVIAGNDPSALCPSLNQAAQAGIKIVSFDSDVNCGNSPKHLFINQADTKTIGTSEVDLLAKMIDSKGKIAILSAAASATNQNAWIKYMKQQLKKYPNMKLVKTVYGNDEPGTSLTVLRGLLSAYPDLRGIISPTTVGISTAAQYLDTHKSLLKHLTLTGLGLPSQMRKYVKDGTVTAFELWDPDKLGYLAGYAAAALASGTLSMDPGSSFTAGKLGQYKVLPPAAGTGPSIVLGPPTVFNKSNIDKYNF